MILSRILTLSIFGVVSILILCIWLTIVSYRLNATRKKHKKVRINYEIDARVRLQKIFYLETARNKDLFLATLIIVEIIMLAASLLGGPPAFNSLYSQEIDNLIIKTFPSCNTTINHIVAFIYIYPAFVLVFILFSMLVATEFMMISYINTYIAARYLGYSLPKTVCLKYIICWIFLGLFLVIFCIRKLQLFLFPTLTITLFLNWLNIIRSSRKLYRAIQSKLDEIRRFEWNPTHFRHLSNNLKLYKYTMGTLITSFFSMVLTWVVVSIWYPLEVLLVGDCYMNKVYGINITFNFSSTTKDTIFLNIEQNRWVIFALEITSIILLMSPSIFIFTYYLANYLHDQCTGRGNTRRINKVLFEPLMESS